MRGRARAVIVVAGLGAGCSTSSSVVQQPLTDEARHARLAEIRDVAAQMGLHNAALLGGIAVSETDLAHCWSEATHACMGPASPDCGGDPVIAGAGDGSCSLMQGGLGMFQFDAGTYAQTLATYGDGVLTIEGNTSLAVNFVVGKVELDEAGVDDWASAMAWMDAVPMSASAPEMTAWAKLMACRYNGCCTSSATCVSRGNGYRDNALAVFDEMGADFWRTSDRCTILPADGVIDQRSACYEAAGDPRFWHREDVGYGGGLEWTNATDAAAPASYGEWRIRTGRAGKFRVEAYVESGAFAQAKRAGYEVHHGGATEVVVVDQSAASGFVSLGDYDFSGEPADDERVRLGDNAGVASSTKTHLAFDAVRVSPVDGRGLATPDAGAGSGEMGGCAVAGGAGGVLLLLGAALVAGRPRRKTKR